MRLRKNTIALAAAACTLLITNASQGAITITFEEIMGNVVASGTGTINATAWAALNNTPPQTIRGGVRASTAMAFVGPRANSVRALDGSSLSRLGLGSVYTLATSNTGDSFGIQGSQFLIDSSILTNRALSGTSTWTNTTFLDLGLTVGTSTFTSATGRETFNVVVVPEPSFVTLACLGVGAACSLRHRVRY